MLGSVEKRLSALEQRRGGKQRVRVIWLDAGESREEQERRRAAARAEVGPGGRVIEIHWAF